MYSAALAVWPFFLYILPVHTDLQQNKSLPDATKTYVVKCNFIEAKDAGKRLEMTLKIMPEEEEKSAFKTLFETAA